MLWTQSNGAPVPSTVYEANPDRVGGRCWTLRDFFAGGLITEHGGSFLNSNQTPVRRLAATLGLELEVVDGGDLPRGDEVFFIDGRVYTYADANADWHDVGYHAFRTAAGQLQSTAGATRLDRMSVPEWLDSTEIGSGSRFGKLMLANTVTENGGDPGDQSAQDLIYLLTGNSRSSLEPLPGDDERFHIVGGNDQLVSRMIAQLPPDTGPARPRARGGPRAQRPHDPARRSTSPAEAWRGCRPGRAGAAVQHAAPRRAQALRALADTKRHVIRTMGMGTNAKIHLELSHKTWPLSVTAVRPTASGSVWRAPGTTPSSSGLTRARRCIWPSPADGSVTSALPAKRTGRLRRPTSAWALKELENVFPGTTGAYTGRAYEDHWAKDPWVRGAYSYYRVGQANTYGQLAGKSEGRFLFAGEHTSIDNIGFLDGAVETGERAARRLLARVGV